MVPAPVSSSAIAADGHPSLVRPIRPYEVPRALSIAEIKQVVADYKKAAQYNWGWLLMNI